MAKISWYDCCSLVIDFMGDKTWELLRTCDLSRRGFLGNVDSAQTLMI